MRICIELRRGGGGGGGGDSSELLIRTALSILKRIPLVHELTKSNGANFLCIINFQLLSIVNAV